MAFGDPQPRAPLRHNAMAKEDSQAEEWPIAAPSLFEDVHRERRLPSFKLSRDDTEG